MTDATREAVLKALEAARRALNEAELLLDHQPPPRGEIPYDDPKKGLPLRGSRPAALVLMVVAMLAFVAVVIALNVWWVRHTWK